MKYLSIDLEATGLEQDCLVIEFAMVPFCTTSKTIEQDLSEQFYIKCPSFESLKPKLNEWVIENNKDLIEKAHKEGVSHEQFKLKIAKYLNSEIVKTYFDLGEDEKIILFGKSMNAIDLPFLNRDLGWDFMRQYFHHQTLDLSSVIYSYVDQNLLPKECTSGTKLMNFLGMGDVEHTALEDAINTAKIYLRLIEKDF